MTVRGAFLLVLLLTRLEHGRSQGLPPTDTSPMGTTTTQTSSKPETSSYTSTTTPRLTGTAGPTTTSAGITTASTSTQHTSSTSTPSHTTSSPPSSSLSSSHAGTTSSDSTSRETTTTSSGTKPPTGGGSGVNVGAIIGGVLGGVALVALVIVGILVYLFKFRNRHSDTVRPMLGSAGRSRPIDLYRFGEILPDLLKDSALLLLEEFTNLCQQSPSIRGQKHVTGLRQENLPKNRYADVLPFDDSRVTLEGKRYINASFIRGFTREREYIAAQGPMGEDDRRTRGKHSTIDDFFEMVWQQDVHCIVMLTQLMEQGRPKCAQYWPREVGTAEQHGIFTVYLHSESDCGTFMTRELELQRSGQSRNIFQYHYKRWPDMTATDESALLVFIRLVRSYVQSSRLTSPLLVHCSAGVGRTGVFIALDIMLQHIRKRSYVDIAACVYALRQQRVRMVQAEEQYIMLYSAMGVAIQQRLEARQSVTTLDGDGTSQSVTAA